MVNADQLRAAAASAAPRQLQGMQRGTKPGWSFIELPPATEQHLHSAIISKVPREWLLDPHGKAAPSHVQRIHSTFVSDLHQGHRAEIEAKFREILSATPPLEARFSPEGVTVGRVDRIKAQPTFGAAIGIVSPQLRALREKIALAAGHGAEVYYPGHGHVSLIYVPEAREAQLRALLKSIGTDAAGQGLGAPFLIDRVVVEWDRSTRREFMLGAGASPAV